MSDLRVAFNLDEDDRRVVCGLDENAEVRVAAGETEITLAAEAGVPSEDC